jgi:hypothetical protein
MSIQIGPIVGVRFSFTVYLIDAHGNGAEKTFSGLPFMPSIDPDRLNPHVLMEGLQLDPTLPEGSGTWRIMTDAEIADYRNGYPNDAAEQPDERS